MSKSAANAEQIAIHLNYAAEPLADIMYYLNAAVTLADSEDPEHGQKFAELRGAAAILRAAIESEHIDWAMIAETRANPTPELDFSGHA